MAKGLAVGIDRGFVVSNIKRQAPGVSEKSKIKNYSLNKLLLL